MTAPESAQPNQPAPGAPHVCLPAGLNCMLHKAQLRVSVVQEGSRHCRWVHSELPPLKTKMKPQRRHASFFDPLEPVMDVRS